MTCKHNVPEPIYCDAVGECHTHTETHSKWEPIEPQPIVPRYTVAEVKAYLENCTDIWAAIAWLDKVGSEGIAAFTKRNREAGNAEPLRDSGDAERAGHGSH